MENHKKPDTESGWKGSQEFKVLKRLLDSKLIYVLLAVFFVLFLLSKSTIFAVLCAMVILVMIGGESAIGISEHGFKRELFELVAAIATAFAIWFGLGLALSTPAPLNAIVSCSMLPNLERGDLVILHGSEPNGIDIPIDEFNFNEISAYIEGEGTFQTNVSLMTYCGYFPSSTPCKALQKTPEKVTENYGPLGFRYGWCTISRAGVESQVQCVRSVNVKGVDYQVKPIGDTIVYTTIPTDGFSGQYSSKEIIHRVFLKVHSGGRTYYITKGDNNDRFDIQYENTPAVRERTSGKVILRVPYLGYFKLFLFGFFGDPPGCDRVFITR
ncbi:MAG: hypothetical protein ABIG39_00545 [Candidatus Micrarchaeota archaeon]